ncbi:hypothetical protein ACFLQY_02075 [Verrucomicrobiota bacterium]
MSDKKEMDVGVQPVDAILNELELSNSDLVAISTEHLTHKQLKKARSGRRVSRNIQAKILKAINCVLEEGEEPYTLEHLFNYKA